MSRMNANIIMSGRQPNIVNTLAHSTQAATLAYQNQRHQQRNALMQEHGPGILAGDPSSLNVLAQFDTPQALQVQQFNRQEERLDQQAQLSREQFDLNLQKFALTKSAAEKAEAAAQLEMEIKRAISIYQTGDLGRLNEYLGSIDEVQIESIDQFPALAALYGDALDVLKDVEAFNAPPAPLSGPGKVQADIDAGRLPEGTPLRAPSTVVNTGDILQSARDGVVDPSTIEPSDAFDSNAEDAVGVTGFAVSAANSIGEAFRLGQPGPEVDQAQTAMTSLSTKTMLGLSAEFPGRPSNLTRERIEDLTVKPGSVWTGPERALNKTRDMIETLDTSIRAANAVLLDPIYTQKDKAQAKTALRQLTTLFADYKALEQSLTAPKPQDGKNTTQSGVSWEVVE